MRYNTRLWGSGCILVDAPVFKTGGGLRRAGRGGFDSHALPSWRCVNARVALQRRFCHHAVEHTCSPHHLRRRACVSRGDSRCRC
jgi:hypothetical protein